MAGFGLKRGVVASGARHQTRQPSAVTRTAGRHWKTHCRDWEPYGRKKERRMERTVSCHDSEPGSCRNWRRKLPTGTDRLPHYKSSSPRFKSGMMIWKPIRSVDTTLTRRKSMRRPNELPNWRRVIMPNTIGRKDCTPWHIPNATVCHQERNSSATGSPTVCIPVYQSPRYFMETSLKIQINNLSQNLLDKYDSGAITLHELVNELFEPWEQIDESQHILLAIALQTAAGGIPTPHVGTGAGGSSSDLPWNDNDKDKYQRPKYKYRI